MSVNPYDPFNRPVKKDSNMPEPLLSKTPDEKAKPVPFRTRVRQGFSQWRARVRPFVPVFVGMVLTFGAMLAYDGMKTSAPSMTTDKVNELVASAMASATPPPSYASRVYQQIAPSLVRVEAQATVGDEKRSLGTGTIIDDAGSVLSSLHVVDKAIRIEVIFYDGTRAEASIAAKVPEQDIVILRPRDLPQFVVPAVLGNPNALNVGDEAFAVGNPFGIRNSMSSGVVSGLNRNFKSPKTGATLTNLIQFDAAANPGNSGGPLLNRDGEIVGVVTALYNPTDQEVFIGIAFAVPIDVAAGGGGSPPW